MAKVVLIKKLGEIFWRWTTGLACGFEDSRVRTDKSTERNRLLGSRVGGRSDRQLRWKTIIPRPQRKSRGNVSGVPRMWVTRECDGCGGWLPADLGRGRKIPSPKIRQIPIDHAFAVHLYFASSAHRLHSSSPDEVRAFVLD